MMMQDDDKLLCHAVLHLQYLRYIKLLTSFDGRDIHRESVRYMNYLRVLSFRYSFPVRVRVRSG